MTLSDHAGIAAKLELSHNGFSLTAEFQLSAGQTMAVVGPNGSGKSTLLATLCGHNRLSRGRLSIAGQLVDEPASATFSPPEDRPIAVAPQDGLLFPHLDVKANIGFGLRFKSRSAAQDSEVQRVLEAVDLAEMGDRRTHELSGGQAQRVALARALVLNEPVLLLDEPLSRVDVANRRLLRQAIETLGPPGQIQVIVTHGPEHARQADLILALEDGTVQALASPEEIMADPPSRWLAELFDQ